MIKYITRTYNTTALTLVGALSTAYAGYHIPLFMMNPTATLIGGFIASIGGIIGANMIKPKHITEYEFGVPIHRT